MRVIAGSHRGAPIRVPRGAAVRPTQDRIREAIFDILADAVTGARVLDLYAGSGALGVEALSRGARDAVFVERSRGALRVLRENLAALGLDARSQVLAEDVLRAIPALARRGERFDLVFLDPPYTAGLVEPTLDALAREALVAPGGLVVAEYAARRPPASDRATLVRIDARRYGDTGVGFYRAGEAAPVPRGAGEETGAARGFGAIYPGAFDPVTNGHLDIIARGVATFGALIVAVARQPLKELLFDVDERKAMIREALDEDARVEVADFDGLLTDFVRARRAHVIVRGLRAVSDFEYEFQMALMNRRLAPDIETVFLMTGETYAYVSSKLVKEIASLGGRVDAFVPPCVVRRLRGRFGGEEGP